MVALTSATAPARDWRLVTLAGGASFAVSYGLLHYVFPIGGWVGSTSAPLTSLVLCAIIAFLAMALTLAVLARMLRTDNQRMRVAINNMSQGLCMFDGNERLVVCNQRYMDMYKVSGDVVKPGITLQNLLKYRISNGSFAQDPVEYRRPGGRHVRRQDNQHRSKVGGRAVDNGHQSSHVRWWLGCDARGHH